MKQRQDEEEGKEEIIEGYNVVSQFQGCAHGIFRDYIRFEPHVAKTQRNVSNNNCLFRIGESCVRRRCEYIETVNTKS